MDFKFVCANLSGKYSDAVIRVEFKNTGYLIDLQENTMSQSRRTHTSVKS